MVLIYLKLICAWHINCLVITYVLKYVIFLLLLSGIQKLVLSGRMGEAIETTQSLYPGLLEQNPNLLFMLKCRQFVEMVNGTDSEVRPAKISNSRSNSPNMSPNYSAFIHRPASNISSSNSPVLSSTSPSRSHSPHAGSQFITSKPSNMPVTVDNNNLNNNVTASLNSVEEMNTANRVMNGDMLNGSSDVSGPTNLIHPDADVEMENLETVNENTDSSRTFYASNGTVMSSSFQNGDEPDDDYDKSAGDMGECFF